MKYKITNTHRASGNAEIRRRLSQLIDELDDPQAAKLYAIARRMRKGREKKTNECSEMA